MSKFYTKDGSTTISAKPHACGIWTLWGPAMHTMRSALFSSKTLFLASTQSTDAEWGPNATVETLTAQCAPKPVVALNRQPNTTNKKFCQFFLIKMKKKLSLYVSPWTMYWSFQLLKLSICQKFAWVKIAIMISNIFVLLDAKLMKMRNQHV
jgi:hypothetical protein